LILGLYSAPEPDVAPRARGRTRPTTMRIPRTAPPRRRGGPTPRLAQDPDHQGSDVCRARASSSTGSSTCATTTWRSTGGRTRKARCYAEQRRAVRGETLELVAFPRCSDRRRRAVASPGAVSAVDAPGVSPGQVRSWDPLVQRRRGGLPRRAAHLARPPNLPPPRRARDARRRGRLPPAPGSGKAARRPLGWVSTGRASTAGRGASVVEHYIFQEEIARRPRARDHQPHRRETWFGPTLIAHGSEAQKRRFLPQILPADELWCQPLLRARRGPPT